jgi:hypothetical protein
MPSAENDALVEAVETLADEWERSGGWGRVAAMRLRDTIAAARVIPPVRTSVAVAERGDHDDGEDDPETNPQANQEVTPFEDEDRHGSS